MRWIDKKQTMKNYSMMKCDVGKPKTSRMSLQTVLLNGRPSPFKTSRPPSILHAPWSAAVGAAVVSLLRVNACTTNITF